MCLLMDFCFDIAHDKFAAKTSVIAPEERESEIR